MSNKSHPLSSDGNEEISIEHVARIRLYGNDDYFYYSNLDGKASSVSPVGNE